MAATAGGDGRRAILPSRPAPTLPLLKPPMSEPAPTPPIVRPAPAGWWLRWGWLLLPLACHLGFSWIGFNPTDDGWLQAGARRLLDGEVPHRDFISVRPVLSLILQVPLVWLGGGHVIWLSRLWGWLTLAAVSWIWSGRVTLPDQPWSVRYGLYAVALLMGAHTFPLMAWHSLDGMLFASLAVVLAARRTSGATHAAFFLAGLAVLCRQNFALFIPVLLLGWGARPREWLVAGACAALPLLGYAGWMAAAGGLADFSLQFWAAGGSFWQVAVRHFLQQPLLWGGLATGLFLAAGLRRFPPAGSRLLPAAIFSLAGLGLAWTLWRDPSGNFLSAGFGLLGLVLGLAVLAGRADGTGDDRLTLGAGLGLAWVTAISIGYNHPALLTGVLLLLLWRLLHRLSPAPAAMPWALMAVLVPVALAFSHVRQAFPYRDLPAGVLRRDVGTVLAGGDGLRTNELTADTLADLQGLTRQFAAQQHPYAILTDFPAFWIRSPQRNPLPSDWPQATELGYSPALLDRTAAALLRLPPQARVIVQKYLVSEYAWELVPTVPDLGYLPLQNWFRRHGRKLGETRYFEVYAPPPPGTPLPSAR
jgi:hypothetical protein